VCSNYRTSHEAPWPSCRCGIYGFRERERAERTLRQYARNNLSGWALGRVSLWGGIVECTHGWRAELAYPYDLIVFTRDADVEAELRSLYAVDVSAASPRKVRGRSPADERRPRPSPGTPRGRRGDEERRERSRILYEEWLRRLEEIAGGGVARGDQELVEALSRVLVNELAVMRRVWNAGG